MNHEEADGALTGGAPQGATHLIVAGNLQAHDATVDGLLDVGGALAATDLLANPSLWIGAAAGVVMILAAIRLRRWRDEG